MAETNPPIFVQAGSHPAASWRQALRTMMGGRSGVAFPASFAVTQNGTPNMSVNVAEGYGVLLGTENTYQGLYAIEEQGTKNLTISAADPTNPRRDLVIARVRDAAYSGAANTFALEVVTGTPAGSPVDPSLPAGTCWVLARVAVAALASSIVNANITDFRFGGTGYTGQNGSAVALGGVIYALSTFRPAAPYAGMVIWQWDTKVLAVYNGATWDEVQAVTPWTAPTFLNSWTNFGAPYNLAKYRKVGDMVQLRGLIAGGTVGTGTPFFLLPTGFRPPAASVHVVVSNNLFGRINVNADGNCVVEVGNNAFVSLDGINFSTV
jgi:hypothetical protein